ncbi:MAG: hypothetical protein E7Z87_01630 [Cyanobacteria bacterium SIG26]|nr:hypothetical protein [Cyanobacteria bacterium SIG26]
MKRFISLLLITLTTAFCAVQAKDVIPIRVVENQVNTVGMYQVGDDIVVYKEPHENSHILYRVRWNSDEFFPEDIGFEKFFAVFIEKKSLALVETVDCLDEWVEIVYDKSTGATGWIKKDDPYKFMTWINFYNNYGKKYGLTLLKGAPKSCLDIKASMEPNAKTIATINNPEMIKLNVIRGNWALVSVFDMDRTPKTGYVRWRSDDGVRYFYPSVK